jgi:hypothetical protein
LPPIILAKLKAILTPKPVPPYFLVVDLSTYSKRSKILLNAYSDMPMPVSITLITTYCEPLILISTLP